MPDPASEPSNIPDNVPQPTGDLTNASFAKNARLKEKTRLPDARWILTSELNVLKEFAADNEREPELFLTAIELSDSGQFVEVKILDIDALRSLGADNDLKLDTVLNRIKLSHSGHVAEADFSDLEIHNIEALKNLASLTILDLSNNKIQDISPLRGLTSLTLYCNKIENISALRGLTALTSLLLSSNEIRDMSALKNLTAGTDLPTISNNFDGLEYLPAMTSHYLYDNKIEDISALKNLTKLTRLDLDTNKIKDISALDNLTKITDPRLGDSSNIGLSATGAPRTLSWHCLNKDRTKSISAFRKQESSLLNYLLHARRLDPMLVDSVPRTSPRYCLNKDGGLLLYYLLLERNLDPSSRVKRERDLETSQARNNPLPGYFKASKASIALKKGKNYSRDEFTKEAEEILEDLKYCCNSLDRLGVRAFKEASPSKIKGPLRSIDPSKVRRSIFGKLLENCWNKADASRIFEAEESYENPILKAKISNPESLIRLMLQALDEDFLKKIGIGKDPQDKEYLKGCLHYEELRRFLQFSQEDQDPEDSHEVSFEPTKGLLTEFSGYICDTCLRTESDIRKNHPNLTFVPFITTFPDGYEWFAGGSLVFEAEMQGNKYWKGGKAFIIRGFNPTVYALETLRLHPGDLFERFLSYLIETAKRAGVSAIIMPWDDRAVKTQTNSPSMNQYFLSSYSKFNRMFLKAPTGGKEKKEFIDEMRKIQACIENRKNYMLGRNLPTRLAVFWGIDNDGKETRVRPGEL